MSDPKTDLTIEGIRLHMARQFGRFDTEKTQFKRHTTRLGTLTEGQWDVIDAVLKNAQSTNGVSHGTSPGSTDPNAAS
jgi:hypothetical protein